MKQIERTFFETTKRFLEPAFHEKRIAIKALIPVLVSSSIALILVYIVKEITNKLEFAFDGEVKTLLMIFIGLVVLHYIIMIFFRNSTHAIMWPQFRKFMYNIYIHKFIYLDNNEAEKLGTGKLIAMIDKGMHAWVDLLVRFFVNVSSSIVMIVFSLFLIGLINIYYAITVFFVAILIFILTYYIQKRAKVYRLMRRDLNINITRDFVKILMSKFEVLQNNKELQESTRITNTLNQNISLNYKVGNLQIYIDLLMRLLIDGSKIGIIILFGAGLYNTSINFGEFLALMSIVYILEQILSGFLYLYVDFTKVFVDVEKLWDFFDDAPSMNLQETGKIFKHKKGKIEVKKLSYGYSKKNLVFTDFDLKIKGEQVTAIVGVSGGGKSTLVKLISGYIRPDKGEILVDNQKLSEVSLKSYYKDIGYLTQEPSVFDGTVLDNLTYAIDSQPISSKDGWINERIEKIIKLAKCEFIYDFQDGIDTEIGEKGIRLSGGQRQRLAIAKIMLKDPKIIILDEPTSALDSFSEEQITKAMHNLFKGRTVIIIAHRLQTVKGADDIILIEGGEVKERGTHKELVKQKGIYKKMLDLQSGF